MSIDIFAGMLEYRSRPEYSAKRSGDAILEYIKDLRDWFNRFLPEE